MSNNNLIVIPGKGSNQVEVKYKEYTLIFKNVKNIYDPIEDKLRISDSLLKLITNISNKIIDKGLLCKNGLYVNMNNIPQGILKFLDDNPDLSRKILEITSIKINNNEIILY